MIIAWIFGVSFGLISGIGISNIPNKKPCVVGKDKSCMVLGVEDGNRK